MAIVIRPERVMAGFYYMRHGENTLHIRGCAGDWRVGNRGPNGWPVRKDPSFYYYAKARDWANDWLVEHT